MLRPLSPAHRPVFVASLALVLGVALCPRLTNAAEDDAAVEKRLADAARRLASDEFEGRGAGTKGLDLAAEFLAGEFRKLGLKTDLFAGTPFQKFPIATDAKPGAVNRLAIVGPAKDGQAGQRIEWKLGEDFTPMAVSGSAAFDSPLVFAGYGITGKVENYDDYAGLDVKGKVVVLLRHEPRQDDAKSAFNGTKPSQHAPFDRKVANAMEHGAAAVLFVCDEFGIHRQVADARKRWQQALDKLTDEHAKFKKAANPSLDEIESQRKRIDELTRQVAQLGERIRAEYDPMLPFEAGGRDCPGRSFPVVSCRRTAMDKLVRLAAGADLASLEREIDKVPSPQSRILTGWKAQGEIKVERTEIEVRNVMAICEGQGPLAEETLVIGAHYDHVGRGGPGSLARGSNAVHPGADDNASGTVAMLEIARRIVQRPQKLRRRVVFIAFAGEERGLLGSAYYVRNPLVPLDKTIVMLNLDMVGRLRDEKLFVGGADRGRQLSQILDARAPQYNLRVTKFPAAFGPSDHLSFSAKQVPVLHFFTGLHDDYHRPGDTADKLNLAGMRRIAGLATDLAIAVAEDEKRPDNLPGK